MTEKENNRHSYNHEQKRDDTHELANERRESIRGTLEHAEQDHKEKIRSSEHEALREAQKLAEQHTNKEPPSVSPAEKRRGPITKKQLGNSFDTQMEHAQEQMNPGSKVFSKLLHSRPVEIVTEAASSTIARPNALLSGSICAFITITLLYFIANHYGFPLSGFETIGAFVVGWIIGILYDYFSIMIRGNKNR